ncbi:hypothetical protein EVAR_84795_1 [Eumeta japonica]|uniref:Uncharacterized protein n=1 Tax=Eumeta variegata TaxID=151549 RepID=A0A4C1U841_EUMVA|nr:hypothetical protein EVAR_84795_1 [Eumeta japonica]
MAKKELDSVPSPHEKKKDLHAKYKVEIFSRRHPRATGSPVVRRRRESDAARYVLPRTMPASCHSTNEKLFVFQPSTMSAARRAGLLSRAPRLPAA